ncbi:hypothetical protein WJX84_009956 [Apatococcus fuscideae]|uniref:Uncharacterized protein n=1 Tax=Apatococcus fuscideae TaxID=2026836 RepID=A0AAW1TK59_9CHLO
MLQPKSYSSFDSSPVDRASIESGTMAYVDPAAFERGLNVLRAICMKYLTAMKPLIAKLLAASAPELEARNELASYLTSEFLSFRTYQVKQSGTMKEAWDDSTYRWGLPMYGLYLRCVEEMAGKQA